MVSPLQKSISAGVGVTGIFPEEEMNIVDAKMAMKNILVNFIAYFFTKTIMGKSLK